jgi:hypothetical protein
MREAAVYVVYPVRATQEVWTRMKTPAPVSAKRRAPPVAGLTPIPGNERRRICNDL